MNLNTLRSIRLRLSPSRMRHEEAHTLLIVGGSRNHSRLLDLGALIYWQGKPVTEERLCLEYGAALEEALRDCNLRGTFAASEQERCTARGRIWSAGGPGIEVALSLFFLRSTSPDQRGFRVSACTGRALPLAWGIWGELGRYLPPNGDPCTAPARNLPSEDASSVSIELGLAHLTSPFDLQLLMEPYWKLRVTEALAQVLQRYVAVMGGAGSDPAAFD
jgi:hypothetical protein